MNEPGAMHVLRPLPKAEGPKEKVLLPKGMIAKGSWEKKVLRHKFAKEAVR